MQDLHIRRRIFFIALCFALSLSLSIFGQEATQTQAADGPLTLHINVHEVIVDVLALDKRNHPVLDLGRDDFEIFEVAGKSQRSARAITMMWIYDPDAPDASSKATGIGRA
jgi:hypothetical protein